MNKVIEMTGMIFGRLTVLERSVKKEIGRTYWRCICECGKETIVLGYQLRSGKTQSCGCLGFDRRREANTTHGESRNRGTPEYRAWRAMMARCNLPNHVAYKDYGGRGIKVCDEWMRFQSFVKDMGYKPTPEHSIDRIDPELGYQPGNCRWATRKEQAATRRIKVFVNDIICPHCGEKYSHINTAS